MSCDPSAPVRLVRDFVNTVEPQLGTDRLVPSTAADCLERLGLLTPNTRISATDLPLLVDVREGLREVLVGHAGHNPTRASAVNELDDLLRKVPVTVRLTDEASLQAVENRVAHQVVATILTAVITAAPDEWMRLKVCARDSCRWAFFDSSRNRSGRWCSMAGCGNIVKMRRAYRAKTAAHSDAYDS